MLDIVFVLAPSQNRFFFELTGALVHELRQMGAGASISTSGFPPMSNGRVYVLFPPHEYFVLEGHEQGVNERLLRRTIFISAEQPGTSHFADNVRLADLAGAIFDINAAGIREYERYRVNAHHLQLGYSAYFDHFQPEHVANLDVLFLGCATLRRLRYLAGCGPTLAGLRTRLVLSDNSRPNTRSSPTFFVGEDKFDLLTTSSVILNVHQSDEPYFEWARVLDAIHAGCVVVTEHSTDYAPLTPGEHFVSARPEVLGEVLECVVEDAGLRARMRHQAYDFIRSELPLSSSVQRILEVADDLNRSRPVRTADGLDRENAAIEDLSDVDLDSEAVSSNETPEPVIPPTPYSTENPELAGIRRILKEVRLDLLDVRRLAGRALLSSTRRPGTVVRSLTSPAYNLETDPRVSILTALYNHRTEIVQALDSLLRVQYLSWEVIVVNDGSSDGSHEVVVDWARQHPEISLLLLSHPVNRGLAFTRNAALDHARGEFVFVLDSDNAVYPNCLTDLVQVLDEDPSVSFAYGILASFKEGRPFKLMSYQPWKRSLFRTANYIDAMAMFRTATLRHMGGYSTDRRLYGWEDYDLYCRLAEAGCQGASLPKPVARYRVSDTSMLSLTDISYSSAFTALKEHAPRLMAQVVTPL
jgi:hypothetical protein